MARSKRTVKTITSIADLQPDPRNANRGTVRGRAMLEDSLGKYGAGRSILVDADGVTIAGAKTLEAAVEKNFPIRVVETDGNELVVVQRTDLRMATDAKAKELGIADNRVAQADLDWDIEALAALNNEIDLNKFWDDDELGELLAKVDQPVANTPDDAMDKAAELQSKWICKYGDLWRIPSANGKGEHRLLCGDSTSAEDVAKVIQGEKSALVVTDPPYGVEYADKNKFLNAVGRGNRIQAPIVNDHGSKTDIQAVWRQAFTNAHAIMRDGAVVYCFMPQGGDQMMMMMMMMMEAGIEPRHELIWLKNNHVLGRADYAYKHEPILYAWKKGGHKYYGGFQTSVIEVDKPQRSELHPTMKPVELIEILVQNSSLKGEAIFDPFGGSGTTMVTCEQLARQCRMIEIEPKYCAVILERMASMGLVPEKVDTIEVNDGTQGR